MTLDSILLNAGSLFFVAWMVVVAGLSVTAFGRDFFPKALIDPAKKFPPKKFPAKQLPDS